MTNSILQNSAKNECVNIKYVTHYNLNFYLVVVQGFIFLPTNLLIVHGNLKANFNGDECRLVINVALLL